MVYPRVYGGTMRDCQVMRLDRGLSPRVRGNQSMGSQAIYGSGSIPACTGEPRHRLITFTTATVYPRVYGGTSPEIGSV